MATVEINIGDTLVVLNDSAIVGRVDVVRADNAPLTHGIALKASVAVCEACGKNEAGEYEGGGHAICVACVHDVLAYRVAMYVLNNVGEFNDDLARAIAILDKDDSIMRASGVSYVDSDASAWDMMRGENIEGVVNYMTPIFRAIVDATRSSGDVPTSNNPPVRTQHTISI